MKKYALVGKKLSYSYSKIIHEYLMKSQAVFERGTYELLEMPNFMTPHGVDGINITNPYKSAISAGDAQLDKTGKEFVTQAICAYFEDSRTISAQTLSDCYDEITDSSVNTLNIKHTDPYAARGGSNIERANTDIFGFLISFRDFVKEASEFAILGAGATSKMLQILAGHIGVPCRVFGRNSASELKSYTDELARKRAAAASSCRKTLLINCTPVGTSGCGQTVFEGIDSRTIAAFDYVADLVYNPALTPLMEIAERSEIPTKNGIEMLVLQAIAAQAIWNACTTKKTDGVRPEISIYNPSSGRSARLAEITASTLAHLKDIRH